MFAERFELADIKANEGSKALKIASGRAGRERVRALNCKYNIYRSQPRNIKAGEVGSSRKGRRTVEKRKYRGLQWRNYDGEEESTYNNIFAGAGEKRVKSCMTPQ